MNERNPVVLAHPYSRRKTGSIIEPLGGTPGIQTALRRQNSASEAQSDGDHGYFFRPRNTRIAPETNAKALDALPALISGATLIFAKAKLETPTRIKNSPAALSIFVFLRISVRSSTSYVLALKG